MISIVSVNHNCLEWMKLLVASVRKFTSMKHEIVILDNHSQDGSVEWLEQQSDIKKILLSMNIGHGRGMDMAIKNATNRHCLVLDIDAHILRAGWDFDIVSLYGSKHDCQLVAAKGGEAKPVHPCVMFFDVEFFKKHKLSFVPTKEYDVGRKLYPDVINLGYSVLRIPVGYEAEGKKFYPGAYGDAYYMNDEPTFYHNWYSARMWQKKQVDSLTIDEYIRKRNVVFNHPHAKGILG